MEDIVRVQVIFKENTSKGTLSDALYFTLDEYNKLTPKDIQAKKKERADKWVADIVALEAIEEETPIVENPSMENITSNGN